MSAKMKQILLKKPKENKIEILRKYQGLIDSKKLRLLLEHIKKTKKEWTK
ncbi:hypothetical protein HRbin35_00431 [bacterium HR35]|nr:hypothetical protein HRbin35_00431 [bacterium HR35]